MKLYAVRAIMPRQKGQHTHTVWHYTVLAASPQEAEQKVARERDGWMRIVALYTYDDGIAQDGCTFAKPGDLYRYTFTE